MKKHKDFCIIMAGGEGRRLWPQSRKYLPKQFIDFFGTGRTLLQQTYDRFAAFIPATQIYVSTYRDYVDLVREQLPDLPLENVLVEPVQLSTAPAAAWASCHIGMREPDAAIIVTPADQHIVREERFREQVQRTLDFVADNDVFVAMGVKTTVPNTAYGYIQMGNPVKEGVLYNVKSFQEKPAAEYARLFVESGEFLWNTGLFVWSARSMQQLLREVTPVVAERIEAAHGQMSRDEELTLVREYYPSNLNQSIDLMLLGRGKNVYVYECDFGWADVGCWPELYEVAHKDVDGNALLGAGKVLLSGCSRNVVCMPEGRAAIIKGLEGYLVAECDNVLVICPNDEAMTVRRLADETLVKLGEEYL